MTLCKNIQSLNKQLSFATHDSFGLAYDKISIYLYYYHLSHIKNNKEYTQLAEKHLDEVIEGINTVKSVDIKSGLAGIGLGIDYLAKNDFVQK